MTGHGLEPVLYFFNPNIHPREEYQIRKQECMRHAASLGLAFVDGDYDHAAWREAVRGLETAPERGPRCQVCFNLRLGAAAAKARDLGLEVFATTLASSRWKSLEQVHAAGEAAAAATPGTAYWAQNWRIEGLVERRAALIKAYGFYQQQYCGCEFSLRPGLL